MSNSAQTSASSRIAALLDENSFVEVGAYIAARNTDFNMTEQETPADGVVTGYGTIGGCLVYVYSQDAAVLGGSMGEMHAKKICNIYSMAMKMGAPVIGLVDCAGLRLQEATDVTGWFWKAVFKPDNGIWSNSSDYGNFRYLRRRYGCICRYGRFHLHGRYFCKTVC